MAILAAAVGVPGLMRAMGILPNVSTLAAVQNIPMLTKFPGAVSINSNMPAPVKLEWAPVYKALVTLQVRGGHSTQYSYSGYGRGYPHKMFCFYNSAGKLMFSIGYDTSNYTSVSYPTTTPIWKGWSIFFYNEAQAATPVIIVPIGPSLMPHVNHLGRSEIQWLTFKLNFLYSYNTEVPADSILKLQHLGVDYAVESVATKIQTTDKTLAKVTIGGWCATGNDGGYSLGVTSAIAQDVEDYSVAGALLLPDAFTSNNKFTGDISAVSTINQDTSYVASSAETSSIFEVSLADLVGVGNYTNYYLCELYTYLRYVQAGGTNVVMRCSLVDPEGNVHASTDSTVTANNSELLYQIGRTLVSTVSAITGVAYTTAAINSMRVRITLI